MKWGSATGALLVAGALAVTALAPMAPGTSLREPGAGVGTGAATEREGHYDLPLTGEVVAPFDDPDVPWGAGHRGVAPAAHAPPPSLAARLTPPSLARRVRYPPSWSLGARSDHDGE